MKKEFIKSLENIADVYIDKHPEHIVDNKILAYDREKMTPYIIGPNVLELGCGDGDWIPHMIKLFGHSYVVDASPKLISHVKSLYGENVTTYTSLFEEFSPPNGQKYNTIIATHILEHVNDPVQVLEKCREWLEPNGVVLIVVPNANSIHRQLAVLMGIQETIYDFSPRDHEVGHLRVYDVKKMRSDISSAGFEVVLERGLFLKMLPNGMMVEFQDSLLKALTDVSDNMPSEWMANIAFVIRPVGQ
jgi:2-polyprenyl-3-methyl-5-hydroxy-6-metoxy-1,4-benzoquinol methylase